MSFRGAGFVLKHPERDDAYLLVLDSGYMKWGFPKGHREDIDARAYDTALRELYEETGLTKDDIEIPSNSPDFSCHGYFFWIGTVKKTAPNPERLGATSQEPYIVQVRYVPREELMDKDFSSNSSLKYFIRTFLDRDRGPSES